MSKYTALMMALAYGSGCGFVNTTPPPKYRPPERSTEEIRLAIEKAERKRQRRIERNKRLSEKNQTGKQHL